MHLKYAGRKSHGRSKIPIPKELAPRLVPTLRDTQNKLGNSTEIEAKKPRITKVSMFSPSRWLRGSHLAADRIIRFEALLSRTAFPRRAPRGENRRC